jgi:tryptophanyl-tRNA synthetase
MTSFSNTIEKNDIIVSGVQSTGILHIGNYYGAVKNYVNLANEIDNPMYFFIADLHSLTSHPNPLDLMHSRYLTLAIYLGCGIDPERATIYYQSDVYYTHELYLYLNMFANMGELERTATFKEKIQKQADNVNAGLLTYPVLMAADILIHKGTKVPVGKDQSQHLEMCRTFGNRFNHYYKKEVFKEPLAFTFTDNLVNIPSLSGKGKMSKSDDKSTAIYLIDSDSEIENKIKRAVTDAGPKEPNSPLSEEMISLFDIMRIFSAEEIVNEYLKAYADCTIRYGDMKKQIAQDAVSTLAPLRENIMRYISNKKLLQDIAYAGAEKANRSARITLEEVRDIMGLTAKNINLQSSN